MRQRIHVKVGLLGSSDLVRVQHYNRCLEKAHNEFITTAFFAKASSIPLAEPSDNTMVTVYIFGKATKVPYKKAKEANMTWYY